MKLRIATFNVENLIARQRMDRSGRADTSAAMALFEIPSGQHRDTIERSLAAALEDDKRQMTALAVAETRADVIALQEVDSLSALEAFFANYVHRIADRRYGHFRLVEGNDRRGIDVGLAARRDLVAQAGAVRQRSHREASFADLDAYDADIARLGLAPTDRVFQRDCLMVDLDLGDRTLSLFVCHFKSMNNGRADGRSMTLPLRRAEARAVRRLVEQRFGDAWTAANWIVLGDLNGCDAFVGPGGSIEPAEGESGLEPLMDGFAVNAAAHLPPEARWTHFRRAWSETLGRVVETHMQLDYVLLSPGLAAANPAPRIDIVRRGLPYRVPLDPAHPDRSIAYLATRNDRYPRVGWDRPKASDHCPLVAEIEVPARRD
ncbi:endonuclease/exonuclease/phosphatase family protein [Chelatococcus sp. SYSU_G07232]|uniref:Endonuclease/exonuclease/phosphatase family protein n=1 Tax=Chelatococcus albus TaxID=3047466 RepID=A0ABT7AGP7_9HYPH|nr:endonuclease/exonuclease/phosphatase family protein [Chelatococcus sp. SYSU_G07232]MDJ1158551.1 endonuclease/exonuclease/phosphatase family protein [Chelatococcus sp. SYSU_G07232]